MLTLKYLIMHDIPVLFLGFFLHLGEHTLFPFVWECLRVVTAPSAGLCWR